MGNGKCPEISGPIESAIKRSLHIQEADEANNELQSYLPSASTIRQILGLGAKSFATSDTEWPDTARAVTLLQANASSIIGNTVRRQ